MNLKEFTNFFSRRAPPVAVPLAAACCRNVATL